MLWTESKPYLCKSQDPSKLCLTLGKSNDIKIVRLGVPCNEFLDNIHRVLQNTTVRHQLPWRACVLQFESMIIMEDTPSRECLSLKAHDILAEISVHPIRKAHLHFHHTYYLRGYQSITLEKPQGFARKRDWTTGLAIARGRDLPSTQTKQMKWRSTEAFISGGCQRGTQLKSQNTLENHGWKISETQREDEAAKSGRARTCYCHLRSMQC